MTTEIDRLESLFFSLSSQLENTLRELEDLIQLLNNDPADLQLRKQCQLLLHEVIKLNERFIFFSARLMRRLQDADNNERTDTLCASFNESCQLFKNRIVLILENIRTSRSPLPRKRRFWEKIVHHLFSCTSLKASYQN